MTFAIYDFGQRIFTPLEPKSAVQKLSEIQPASAVPSVQQEGESESKKRGSQGEEQQAQARHQKHAQMFASLANRAQDEHPIFVMDIMSTALITAPLNATVHAAHALMIKTGVRHLPILDQSSLMVGLLSDRDILKAILNRQAKGLTVEAIMERKVLTAEPRTDIRQAAQVLKEYHIGCLPVVNPSGALVGIVSRTDLLGVLSAYGPLHIRA